LPLFKVPHSVNTTLLLALLLGLAIAALSAAQPLLTRIVIDQGSSAASFLD